MVQFHLQYFGGVALIGGGTAIRNFGTVRAAKLLALLGLSRSGSMPRAQLAEQLWPEDLYDSTRLRLRQEIHRLKRMLGGFADLVGSDTNDVWLNRTAIQSDLDILLDLAKGKEAGAYEHCLQQPFLPGWDDAWAMAERAVATKVQLQAAVALARRHLEEQAPAHALQVVKRLIPDHPINEQLRTVAIKAHTALGSASAALAEFHDYRREVRELLGIEPADLTADLIAEATDSAIAKATLESAPDHVHDWSTTVPMPIDPIFGREDIIDQIIARLDQPGMKLVTLVGPGGIGKTRLATEVANRMSQRENLRVAFVSMADVGEPDQWPRAVLAQLNEMPPTESDPLKYLAALLQQEATVLFLDNLETVLPEAGPDLKILTAGSRNVKLVATSVSPSRSSDEVLVPIGPLDPASAGQELLRTALLSVRPQALQQSDTDKELLAISRRLDGYPLALRLVSARFRLLTPKAILDQMDVAIAGKSPNDLPERHRSLESALASSWEALSDVQRQTLIRIAAYPGGLTMDLAALEFEGEDYLDQIERLLDAALLNLDEQGNAVRIRMLAPVQAFVRSRTDEAVRSELEERASKNALRFLDSFDLYPWTPLVPETLVALDGESENVAAAWRWAYLAEPALAYRHAAKFARYESARGRARALMDQFLSMREGWQAEDPHLVFELELTAAFLAMACHLESHALEPLLKAGEIATRFGDPTMAARCECWLAQYYFRVDFAQVEVTALRALDLAEAIHDPYLAAKSRALLGTINNYRTNYAEALECFVISYRMFLELNGGSEAASAGINLAGHLWQFQRDKEADVVIRQCREILAQTRVPTVWAFLHEMVGRIALDRGRPEEAEESFREALRIWQAVGSAYQEADQHHSLCCSLWAQGRYIEARLHLVECGKLWYKDNNKGGLCAALNMVARSLAHSGRIEEARSVIAFSLEFQREFDLVLVGFILDDRTALLDEVGGAGTHGKPLTIESCRGWFDRI